MKPFVVLAAGAVLCLSSCTQVQTSASQSGPTHGTTHAEITEAYSKTPPQFSKVTLSCKIVSPGKTEELPKLVLRPGRAAGVHQLKTINYPVDFSFPELPSLDPSPVVTQKPEEFTSFPVTPAQPLRFESAQVGWKLNAKLTRRKSFMMISGMLIEKKEGSSVLAAGIPFEPIVTSGTTAWGRPAKVILTENRAERPAIETREIPILIAALPSEVNRIYLDEKRTTYAEFQCDLR